MAVEYAKGTKVSPSKTELEIRQALCEFGVVDVALLTAGSTRSAAVLFVLDKRQYRLRVPLPDPDDSEFTQTTHKRPRKLPEGQRRQRVEQATKERWRALLLLVKAKLQAIRLGVTTFESEFLGSVTLTPDGQTVADFLLPRLAQAIEKNQLPQLPLA